MRTYTFHYSKFVTIIFRLCMICTFSIGPTNFLSAQEIQLQGDVTHDGVIDGRDALRILQSVKGITPLPEEETSQGDVYPLPGTGGFSIGDGQLTEEDAMQILLRAVDLISFGEITGDFSRSAPAIHEFTPWGGAIGSQVTIIGENFVSGNPGENTVSIGGVPAQILHVSGTKIVVTVSPGTESGLIHVITPGGKAESRQEFKILQVIEGTLKVDGGLDPRNFTVGNIYEQKQIQNRDGSFQLAVPANDLLLIMASMNQETDNDYMAFLLPEVSSPLVISSYSTAKALLFMNPFLLTDDPEDAKMVIDLMDTLPEIQELANVIAERYPQGADGLDDPNVNAALVKAMTAVMNHLPEESIVNRSDVTQPKPIFPQKNLTILNKPIREMRIETNPPLDIKSTADATTLSEVNVYGIDLDFIKLYHESNRSDITVKRGGNYSPLDWVVVIYKLDPSALPNGLNESFLDLKQRYLERKGYFYPIFVPGNPWTGNIDIVYTIIDRMFSDVDYLDIINSYPLPYNIIPGVPVNESYFMYRAAKSVYYGGDYTSYLPLQEDNSLYIIRAYSGVVPTLEPDDLTVLKLLPDGNLQNHLAYFINFGIVAIDIMDLLTSTKLRPGNVALKKAFMNGYRKLAQKMSSAKAGIKLEDLWEVGQELIKAALSAAPDKVIALVEKQWETSLKSVSALLLALDKISSLGRAAERLYALQYGKMVNVLGWEIAPGPSQLETALVVTGDPFTPKITKFEPDGGTAGQVITIYGERFARHPENNSVYIGSRKAKVISANPPANPVILKVEIPDEVGRGNHKIRISTKASSKVFETQDTFHYEPFPIIDDVEPAEGYAANPLNGYSGSTIGINGHELSFDGLEYVYIGGKIAPISIKYNNRLVVNVPELSPGKTELYLFPSQSIASATPLEWIKSKSFPFTVLDKPVIEKQSVESAQAGHMIILEGRNLDDSYVVINNDNYSPLDATRNVLRFQMPSVGKDDEEIAVRIRNPAGLSDPITIIRIPGVIVPSLPVFAKQAIIPVTDPAGGYNPNGKISFDEAAAFSRGDKNPFLFTGSEPFDDQNQLVIHHYVQIPKTITGPDGNPQTILEWTQVAVDNPVNLETNNGPAHEKRHHLRRNKYPDGKTEDIPLQYLVEDLDSEAGNGPEEGDLIQLNFALEDYQAYKADDVVDKIRVMDPGTVFFSTLKLSFGVLDEIVLGQCIVQCESTQPILLRDGNSLSQGVFIANQPIRIEGNSARILSCTLEIQSDSAAGIQIENGFGAEIDRTVTIIGKGGHAIHIHGGGANRIAANCTNWQGKGILIEDGQENVFNNVQIMNSLESGVEILRGSKNNIYIQQITNPLQYGVVLRETTGNLVQSQNSMYDTTLLQGGQTGLYLEKSSNNECSKLGFEKCRETGVLLKDANENQFSQIFIKAVSNGHGIKLDNSLRNHFYSFICENCGQHGLHISNQSQFNHFSSGFTGGCLHGFVVTGENTQNNVFQDISAGGIQDADITLPGNRKNGILIQEGASFNNFYHITVAENGAEGVLIQGATTAANRIEGGYIGFTERSSAESQPGNFNDGIRIHQGANHSWVRNLIIINNGGNGIIVQGENTNFNTIEECSLGSYYQYKSTPNSLYGVLVLDNAAYTTIHGCSVFHNGEGGILINNVQLPYDPNHPTTVVERNMIGYEYYSNPGNPLENSGVFPVGVGVHIDNSVGVHVVSNKIIAYPTGIRITGSESSRCRLISNQISEATGTGIHFKQAKECTLDKNSVKQCNGDGIRFENCKSISLSGDPERNVVIKENCGNGVTIRGCDGIYVYDQESNENKGNAGIWIENSKNVSLDRVSAYNNQNDGIVISRQSTDINVTDSLAENNQGNGTVIRDAQRVTLVGTPSERNPFLLSSNGLSGLILENAQEVTVGSDGRVGRSGNISSNEEHGILIRGESTNNVLITECYIQLNGNGYFDETKSGEGIKIEQGKNIRIGGDTPPSGNTIYMHHYNGILAKGSQTTVSITHNIFGNPYDVQHAGLGQYDCGNRVGILLEEDISGVWIAQNKIRGNIEDGIVLRGGANHNTIVNNEIYENGENGVIIENESAKNNEITSNKITDNGLKGIDLDNGNGNVSAPFIDWILPEKDLLRGGVNAPNGSRIEIYADYADEGERLVGLTTVRNKRFKAIAGKPNGYQYHALVIHPNGNTSEFGPVTDKGELKELPTFAYASWILNNQDIFLFSRMQDYPIRLTEQIGRDYDPQLDASGKYLLFVSERSGNPDLWMLPTDQNEPTPMTFDPAPDYDPELKSDFTQYAFVSERDGNPEIYLADIDLENQYPNKTNWEYIFPNPFMIRAFIEPPAPVRLTNHPGKDRYPSWSNSGDQIAFTSDRDGKQDIWILNTDGSELRKVTANSGNNYKPAWSPDDNQIAFVSDRDGNPEIYVLRLDTNQQNRITNHPAIDDDPTWDASGKKIIFVSDREGGKEIYSVEYDSTSIPQRITYSSGSSEQPDIGPETYILKNRINLISSTSNKMFSLATTKSAIPLSESLNIEVESATKQRGDSVTLNVRVANAENLGNLAFDIETDPTLLHFIGNEVQILDSDSMCAFNPIDFPSDLGMAKYNWIHPFGYSNDNTLITLEYLIGDRADQSTTNISFVNVAAYDIHFNPIPFQWNNGVITISVAITDVEDWMVF